MSLRNNYSLTIGQVVDMILKNNTLVFECSEGVCDVAFQDRNIYWIYKQRGKPKEKLNPCLVDQNKRFRVKLKEYTIKGFTSGFVTKDRPLTSHDINLLMLKDFKAVKTTKHDREVEIFIREV